MPYIFRVGQRVGAHIRQAWGHGRALARHARDAGCYMAIGLDYLRVKRLSHLQSWALSVFLNFLTNKK